MYKDECRDSFLFFFVVVFFVCVCVFLNSILKYEIEEINELFNSIHVYGNEGPSNETNNSESTFNTKSSTLEPLYRQFTIRQFWINR